MKTSNNSLVAFIGALCVVGTLFFVTACNSLNADPDISAKPTITGKEIYLTANGSSIIDLRSRVSTTLPVTLAVTSLPSYGSLSSIGNGLLQYSPNQLKTKTRDAFQFTVYGSNNEVIQNDSIILIVENDSTQLPCGIYANPDMLTLHWSTDNLISFTYAQPVKDNDVICTADSADFQLTIPSFGAPHKGTAVVVSNRYITYSTNPPYSGYDTIIYKIQSQINPSHFAYGFFIITFQQEAPCVTLLQDDYFNFNYDSLHLQPGDTLKMNILQNDAICGISVAQVTTPIPFQHGNTYINPNRRYELRYLPDSIPPATSRSDSARYQECVGTDCHEAWVRVLLIRN